MRLRRFIPEQPAPGASPSASGRLGPFCRDHWPVLVVVAVAFGLRLYGLSRRLIVLDESLIYDPNLLRLGLREFTWKVWAGTTYNPGWAGVVWVAHRLFGASTFWVRMPSCLASAAASGALYAAARSMGLSRLAGLVAGSVLACSIFQVEYGQQILPHAVLPLGAGLCLWLVTTLARPETRSSAAKQIAVSSLLLALFGSLVVMHNSALLLAPPLLLYWIWGVLSPGEIADRGDGRARRVSLLCVAACAVAVGFASLGWFFAKVGEADRFYLRPFYLSTFLDSPDRVIASDLLNAADDWYRMVRPASDGWKARAADLGYFSASRGFDFLYGGFKLRGEQQLTGRLLDWWIPGLMVAAVFTGVLCALTGLVCQASRRWVACFVLTAALVIVLSGLRLFPIGGIRHLICMSPLVVLTACAAIDTRARWLSRGVLFAILLWGAGDLFRLPRYYRTTRDYLGARRLEKLARQYGVRDVVSGDTLCSKGALTVLVADYPRLRTLPSDDPDFVELVKQHRPFLLCSLHDPLLEKSGGEVKPTAFFKNLAHPLATLNQYTATPLVQAARPIAWLNWTVYLLRPKTGPYPPEVLDVTPCGSPRGPMPWGFAVRFSKPVRPQDVNGNSVRLNAKLPEGGWSTVPVAADVTYLAESRTAMLVPRAPLPPNNYVLTVDRTVKDEEGRPLDADDRAFYHVYWGHEKPLTAFGAGPGE
jgi:hypothetical protein